MIRHYSHPDDVWPILAQAKRGRVWVVFWTWRGHRVVLTKAKGAQVVKAWKNWHRRKGWEIRGDIATHPETGERHSVALRELSSENLQRITLPG